MFEIFQNYLTRNCIVVGGWPCTGYSIAGKKNGDENEDSALWKEFLRCIRLLEPNWVIAENSANIRSFNIEKIEKKYNEIGYAVEWHVIPSCSVGGVSRRERIYFIANRYGVRCFPETDATSEEKSKWWTEARALIGSKWPSQPEPSRMDLRNPTGLDEAIRRKRVQLCGMSLDPRIPFIIGARINAIECEINKKPRREGVVYV
jgi:site-specific DNA-cytosine methylase